MSTAGIRFSKDLYVNVTVNGDNLSLYTVDAKGNKTEYNVTKANRRKAKEPTEENK